jgi:hypothetical protein
LPARVFIIFGKSQLFGSGYARLGIREIGEKFRLRDQKGLLFLNKFCAVKIYFIEKARNCCANNDAK